MRKVFLIGLSILAAFAMSGCAGKGKVPIGKGKAPVIHTRG